MDKKIFCFSLSAMLFALCSSALAQQPAKLPRIGFVTAGSSSTIAARIEALRQGLRDLGYIEDKNIIIEWRFGEGKVDRLPALVAELVRLKVDVLLSAGAAVTGPAGTRREQSPSSWLRIPIPSETGSSPALRDLVEISPDSPPIQRS
jgi:putative ABC transport system substrate-binding protein